MAIPGAPPQRLAWFLGVAVLCGIYFHFQVQLPQSPPYQNRNDFKHLFLGSRLLWRGEDPYSRENLEQEAMAVGHPDMRRLNPYVYPPFNGYFFGWLGLLDYETAVQIWFWSGHLLLLLSFLLLWGSMAPYGPLERWGIFLATVSFAFPLFRSTTAGQLNHFLLFLLCLVAFLLRERRMKAAGAVIGLAALIKVQPALLLLWLGWKREWAGFGTALLVIFLLVLIPGVWFGLNPYFDYFQVASQMSYGSSTWSEHGMSFYVDEGNIGFPALVYRLFSENPKTVPWFDLGQGAYWICFIWGVLILAVCLLCCRIARKDEDLEMEMGTWVFGMLLIPSLFWDHYLVLAILPWMLLLSRLPGLLGDRAMILAAISWVWANWWFIWFREENLAGLRLILLNVTLPPVLVLFGMSAFIARFGKGVASQPVRL